MQSVKVLPDTAGLLLMGGRSRRMGADKAQMDWDGCPLWERQYRLLQRMTRPVFRSVAHDRPAETTLTLVDPYPYPGPLWAIATALAAMPATWLLVLAVDLPCVPPRLLQQLWQYRLVRGVVLPTGFGRDQPLAALWHRQTLEPVQGALARGDSALRSVLETLPVRRRILALHEQVWLTNVNTPEDWRVLRDGLP